MTTNSDIISVIDENKRAFEMVEQMIKTDVDIPIEADAISWIVFGATGISLEIVRCKDCKHCINNGDEIDNPYRCNNHECDTWEVQPEFFCAYGERKA